MYPSRQSEACWLPKMSLVRININISIPSDLTVLVLFSTELPYLTLPHCSCPTADTCLPYLGTHCEFSLQGPHLQYLHPITKHLQAPPSTSPCRAVHPFSAVQHVHPTTPPPPPSICANLDLALDLDLDRKGITWGMLQVIHTWHSFPHIRIDIVVACLRYNIITITFTHIIVGLLRLRLLASCRDP